MKITKRDMFLSLGTIAAVTTPVVYVVSCGSDNKNTSNDNNTATSISKKADITKELVSKMNNMEFFDYIQKEKLVTIKNNTTTFNNEVTFEKGVSFPQGDLAGYDFTNLPQEQKNNIILKDNINTDSHTRFAGLNLDQIDTFPLLEEHGNNIVFHNTTWSNKAIISGKQLKFDFLNLKNGTPITPSKAYTEENGVKTYYKYDGTNWTSASESDSSWQKWFDKLIKEHNYSSETDLNDKQTGQIMIICGLQNDETITRP